MSHVLLLISIYNTSIDANEIRKGMRQIPECEWSEDYVLELISILSNNYYDDLFECVPERCKTRDVWVTVSVYCSPFLTRVPSKIATQSFYEDVVRQSLSPQCSTLLSYIPRRYRTTKLCMIAIESAHIDDVLQHVPHEFQTEELILAALEMQGGASLAVAAIQTRNICMAAVGTAPTIISCVKDQTLEICKMAILTAAATDDVRELRDVVLAIRNHSTEVCIGVLRYWPNGLEYLRNHSLEVCLKAIELATPPGVPQVLKDIREQTLEVCLAAHRKMRSSYQSIRDPALRRQVVRLVLAHALIPLRGVDLSASLLTEVGDCLTGKKFPPILWEDPQLLTPMQMWALAVKVKHI